MNYERIIDELKFELERKDTIIKEMRNELDENNPGVLDDLKKEIESLKNEKTMLQNTYHIDNLAEIYNKK